MTSTTGGVSPIFGTSQAPSNVSTTGDLIITDGASSKMKSSGMFKIYIPARKFFTSLILLGKDSPGDKAD